MKPGRLGGEEEDRVRDLLGPSDAPEPVLEPGQAPALGRILAGLEAINLPGARHEGPRLERARMRPKRPSSECSATRL